MVDEYHAVTVNRISPEFPMPIMHSERDRPVKRPGGAANVAYQFKHFNVGVTFHCFMDRQADRVFLRHGVRPWSMTSCENINAKLPIKRRFLDNGIQVKRLDIERPNCGLSEDAINFVTKQLIDTTARTAMTPDVVILSDYNKGFFASEEYRVLDAFKHSKTIVDPKKGPLSKWKGCTIFKPNASEAYNLTGKTQWKEQAKHLQNELECEAVVITSSAERVSGVWKDEFFCYQPGRKVEVESVVGAGDCFGAIFAACIGHGFTIPEAAEIAWNAGAIYVQGKMNRPIVPAELVPDGIVEPYDLQSKDFKLVLTNGCFDVLHKGHMETLKFAKSKGDKLVVAVNSDASIKRLKGESRPLVPLEHRMAVLSSLKFVDFVVAFDEDTPFEIIKTIHPDVLVKGGDYDPKTIIGADIVREVHVAPMINDPGSSSSSLLDEHYAYLQQQDPH